MPLLDWLFESQSFVPHGHCYLWQPTVLWTNVVSDALIAGAYFAIPFIIWRYLAKRRGEVQSVVIPVLFAAFIFLCGLTHVMEIYTVWTPTYRVAGVLKALTAIASVLTAVSLVAVLPHALQLRTPKQLEREVETRTEALEVANARMREEVEARRRSEEALRTSEMALRDASNRLHRFLATLSHELRNPLAPIVNATVLLEGAALAGAAARARDVIARQVQHLARLLDDLIDLSRVVNDRVALQRRPTAIEEVVRQSLEAAYPEITAKAHDVRVEFGDSALVANVDPLRLTQILTNLLMNASKYQAPGGVIEVRIASDDGWARITVRDEGIGISAADLQTIFEPFSRIGDPTMQQQGLGLGLTLSRQLVQLHGGCLSARSDGPGRGATFEVRLPLRAEGTHALQPVVA